MPAVFNLDKPKVYRGDTYPLDMMFWHDLGRTMPVSVNTASDLKAEVRRGTGLPVLGTFDITVLGENHLHLELSSTTTAALPRDNPPLYWDLQATWDIPPSVLTLVRGTVIVEGDITDSGA